MPRGWEPDLFHLTVFNGAVSWVATALLSFWKSLMSESLRKAPQPGTLKYARLVGFRGIIENGCR